MLWCANRTPNGEWLELRLVSAPIANRSPRGYTDRRPLYSTIERRLGLKGRYESEVEKCEPLLHVGCSVDRHSRDDSRLEYGEGIDPVGQGHGRLGVDTRPSRWL
jgi:hypothetical protein